MPYMVVNVHLDVPLELMDSTMALVDDEAITKKTLTPARSDPGAAVVAVHVEREYLH